MSDSDFVQERAYIYQPTEDELELMQKSITQFDTDEKDEECQRGIVIFDILGE